MSALNCGKCGHPKEIHNCPCWNSEYAAGRIAGDPRCNPSNANKPIVCTSREGGYACSCHGEDETAPVEASTVLQQEVEHERA